MYKRIGITRSMSVAAFVVTFMVLGNTTDAEDLPYSFSEGGFFSNFQLGQ